MKKLILGSILAATAAMPAFATVTVSSVDGSAPYGAPATFNFDGATPAYSGSLYFSSAGPRAQPAGSTGGYAAVGPGNTESSAVLDLSSFGLISSITFLWGSVDTYNFLDVLGTGVSFSGGSNGVSPATGNQTDANSNRLVTLTFTGADRANVTGLQFSATANAFEFDNVSVASVPEAATWAMFIGGFGMIGGAVRSRRTKASVSFA